MTYKQLREHYHRGLKDNHISNDEVERRRKAMEKQEMVEEVEKSRKRMIDKGIN